VRRPLCKHCVKVIAPKSFCWAEFDHAQLGKIRHLFWYCDACKKRAGYPIPRVHLTASNIAEDAIPVIHVDKEAEATERVEKHRKQPRTAAEIMKLREMPYREYLQTEHWKLLREKCIRRAKCLCQLCNQGGTLNVHHRTYERRGCEFLKDLIVLCRACHAKFHDKLP